MLLYDHLCENKPKKIIYIKICYVSLYHNNLIYLSPSPAAVPGAAEGEGAERAEGGAGLAEGSAVKAELMAESGLPGCGNVFPELVFDTVRIGFFREVKPFRKPFYMRVHDDRRYTEAFTEDHIRCLPAHTGYFQ